MMPHAVDPAGPVEPLAESAPLAWAIAPRLCPGDPQSPSACVWYHRVWQYLRLLGVITSIRTNSAFLTRTFDGLALNHPRVLVSGSADYAMLAHLWHAYAGRPLDVTVVDLCPTALYLNEWYAGRLGFRLSTVHSDALEYMTNRPYQSGLHPQLRGPLRCGRSPAAPRPMGHVAETGRSDRHDSADPAESPRTEESLYSRRRVRAERSGRGSGICLPRLSWCRHRRNRRGRVPVRAPPRRLCDPHDARDYGCPRSRRVRRRARRRRRRHARARARPTLLIGRNGHVSDEGSGKEAREIVIHNRQRTEASAAMTCSVSSGPSNVRRGRDVRRP